MVTGRSRARALVAILGFAAGAGIVSNAGCSSAGSAGSDASAGEAGIDIFAKQVSVSVLVLDMQDIPIPGATIDVDGIRVSGATGSDGRVKVMTPATSTKLGIRISATAFVDNVQVVDTGGAAEISATASLLKVGTTKTLDPKAGGTVDHNAGSAQFGPDSFVSLDGRPVTGQVEVSITMVTPEDVAATGTFGINGQPDEVLRSLGALAVTATSNGKPVMLAPGKQVQLALPANIPATTDAGTSSSDAGSGGQLPPGTPPPPVWKQNAKSGGWDSTPLKFTQTGSSWVAQVDSLATWNCDYPERVTCVRGLVKTPAGKPLGGAVISGRMTGLAAGFLPATTVLNATTGSAGTFCMEVVPRSELTLTIACPDGPSAKVGPFTTPSTQGARCSGGSCADLGSIEACCKVDSDCKTMGDMCLQGVCKTVPDGGGCNSNQVAGGNAPETRTIELGKKNGAVTFSWDMKKVKDQMKVVYQGVTVFDTGCVSLTGTKDIPFAGTKTSMDVAVTPNCEAGSAGMTTVWSFNLSCPN